MWCSNVTRYFASSIPLLKRKTLFTSIFLFLFFLLSIPVNVHADIYRCKDANSRWYFTNSPSEDTRCDGVWELYRKNPSTSVGKPSPEMRRCTEALKAEHWKDAFGACYEAARQGYTEAQFYLGLMYHEGHGVPQNYAEAVKWCRKAAEQGIAEAQYNLGLSYANGQGLPQDYAEAVKWWHKAAEQGNAEAQYSLGVMYALGKGVMQSGALAADWYYKAGIAYLKVKQKDMALTCVERIQDLKSKTHLNVPNYFLAERLMQKIYGGN